MDKLIKLVEMLPHRRQAGMALAAYLAERDVFSSFIILTNRADEPVFAAHAVADELREEILAFYADNELAEMFDGVADYQQELLAIGKTACGRVFYRWAGAEVAGVRKLLAVYLYDYLLYQKNQDKVWGTYYISEVTKAFTASLDLKEIAGRLIVLISDYISATSTALFLVDQGEPSLFLANGFTAEDHPQLAESLREKLARLDLAAGCFYISSHLDQVREDADALAPTMIAPFIIAGKVIGYLAFYGFALDVRITQQTIDILETLMQQGAIALHNARLYNLTREMSITDELTALFNYRYFMGKMRDELSRAARYDLSLVLMLLDLDDFKKVNDTYGHPCGDVVLQEFGGILKKLCRSADVVARYGGEEFAVLLTNTPKESAQAYAERIRAAVEAHLFDRDNKNVKITTSIGIANYPVDARDVEELICNADAALYKAKKAGKNTYILYS